MANPGDIQQQLALLSSAVGRMQRWMYRDCTMPEYSVCVGSPGDRHPPHPGFRMVRSEV